MPQGEWPRPQRPDSDPEPEYGYLTRPLEEGATAWHHGWLETVHLNKTDLDRLTKQDKADARRRQSRPFGFSPLPCGQDTSKPDR